LPPQATPRAALRVEPFPSARTRSSQKPLILVSPNGPVAAVLNLRSGTRAPSAASRAIGRATPCAGCLSTKELRWTMRSFQSSEPNRTFDTKTEASHEGKGDVICVWDSDSYGVEIGWVLQTANEKTQQVSNRSSCAVSLCVTQTSCPFSWHRPAPVGALTRKSRRSAALSRSVR
jgi:hypothetical protein